MSERSPVILEVRRLLDAAFAVFQGTIAERTIEDARRRLDEPLRVAIAGKVKAGKSTLLNALVGEELAPTDAGECTKIVTWYRNGLGYKVILEPKHGPPRQIPFRRELGALDPDLGGTSADEVVRLIVEWPSGALREMTLIDTPGIGSISTDVSARAHAFLTPETGQPSDADAVIYLMRHLHQTDLRFLETFKAEDAGVDTPLNAVAVLSRADEVGSGSIDALGSAARIAERYRRDDRIKRVCQTVVPVAGLLAASGAALREDEYRALSRIAAGTREQIDELLLTADRFARASTPLDVIDIERQALLDRLGMFGVRISVALIRRGSVTNALSLAQELVARSGLSELRHVLLHQFAARRDVLQARSALARIETLVRSTPIAPAQRLLAEAERITAGAHEFAELHLVSALRTGAVKLRPDELVEAERLLGAQGSDLASRLGLPPDADAGALTNQLGISLSRWQRRGQNPLSSREVVEASTVLVRTCEGLYQQLARRGA
jgi:50S ribosome-binding GTPase